MDNYEMNLKKIGKIISHKIIDNEIHITFEQGSGLVAVVSDTIIQVNYDPKEEGSPSKAIEKECRGFREFSVKCQKEQLILQTNVLEVRIDTDYYVDVYDRTGKPIVLDYRKELTQVEALNLEQVEVLTGEGHAVNSKEKQELYVAKKMDGEECFYGLGETTGFLNKRHYDYVMWNTDDPSPQVDHYKSLYKSIPFFITLKKDCTFGIFFDNTYKTYFDMGKFSEEYYLFGCNKGALNYYIIYGESIKSVIGGYTFLTGTTPLPQLWTLGYQQSKWGYIDQKDIAYIADNMRSHKIPCDVIHMDIDYMDGYRVFTWDEKRHKNPEQELKGLLDKGIKIVTIIDPGVKKDKGYYVYEEGREKDYFATDKDGITYVNAVWPGDSVYPDFGKKEVRTWWGENHKNLIDAGVSGIWNDMNEPASFNGPLPDDVIFHDEEREASHAEMHNIYGLQMGKATYEYWKEYTGKRPFVITRACYSGAQKYTTAWTGDNHSMWGHLQMAIPQLCNLGMSGMSFVGTDIGGFSADTTPELLIRWVQMAVFSPLFRNHSALGTRYQEPWKFDKTTLDIYRRFVEFRYAILPYLYDLLEEGTRTGLPVMRSMVMEYPLDEVTKTCNEQFMVGEQLLVAPVVMQGSVYKNVYLPEGVWYDIHTNKRYEGGTCISYYAPIDCCPMFAKEGSILPMYPPMQYVGEVPLDTLHLHVFGESAEYIHYQDNGTDFSYEQGNYNRYEFKVENGELTDTLLHKGYENVYENVIIYKNGKISL